MINTKYDIIILAGQSNAEGCGLGEDDYQFLPSEKIDLLKGDFSSSVKKTEYGNEYLGLKLSENYYIEQAKYKKNEHENDLGCFALPFANEYKNNILAENRKVLIIQSAIGGTGFSKNHWGVDNILYDRLCKMTRFALSLNNENRLVAFLWHQGEHDSFENEQLNFEERKEFYYNKLSEMLTTFRKEFGNVPFVCAGFTRQWFESYSVQCQAVYDATQKVINENEITAFITNTQDLKSNAEKVGNDDTVHFCKESQSILGLRYYNKWREIN